MNEGNIQPVSNNQLTKLRNLGRKKGRYKEGEFLLEGQRAIKQVLENGVLKILALYFNTSDQLWQSSPWKGYINRYEARQIEDEVFQEITDTDNPQGVLARIEMSEEASPEDFDKEGKLIIAFDGVQDPGNVGTIIRSATWFGCSGVLVGKGTVDPFHPKVVRSTAGATGILPYQTGSLEQLLPAFSESGWRVLALDPSEEAADIASLELSMPAILVAGNEAHGIRPEVYSQVDAPVKIASKRGGKNYMESINVAVSTGISIYELTKG